MKPLILICLLGSGLLLTSCFRYGIYQHSMVQNSHPYQAIPLQKDGSKSALYAGGSISGGYVNHLSKDGTGAVQGTLHRGTNFGHFQAHYGVNGTLGFYRASDYGEQSSSYYYNSNLNNYLIDSINGTKYFGSVGISAGINTLVSFDDGGEWRVIGLQFTHQYELDNNYSAFRRKISIQDANVVEHTRHYSTLGFTSELLIKVNPEEYLGYKVVVGGTLGNPRFYESYSANYKIFRTFLNQYLNYNFKKGTFYLQGSIGYYSYGAALGFNLKIK